MSSAPAPFAGVLAPVVTPFADDLSVDRPRFAAFCRHLLATGCDGLAVFGTTSEANSLSLAEKRTLLDDLAADDGVPAARLMPGTGACNLPETVELTRAAVEAGAGGVLMLPPFYYKGVSADGLFRHYAEVIERVGDPRLRVYLYHIPKMSGVAIDPALIARLRETFGEVVAGVKDSGGDWPHTESLLREFPDLAIFPGSETFLAGALDLGGPGCISATANWQPAAIRAVVDAPAGPERDARDTAAVAVRRAFETRPLIPGLKAMLAEREGDEAWTNLRPPLTALDAADRAALADALAAAAAETV